MDMPTLARQTGRAAAGLALLWLVGCSSVRAPVGAPPSVPAATPRSAPGKIPPTPAPTPATPAEPAAPDASVPRPTPVEPGEPAAPNVETGVASWYGKPFHGRRTASGERYDMNALTAAHRTLPFQSLLRVRNLDNQREVIVRVNDRGPFRRGRIIDLSRAAARALGIAGIAQVEIRPVGDVEMRAEGGIPSRTDRPDAAP